MFNFISSYLNDQKFKKSETLCTIASMIMLGMPDGFKFLNDYDPEIMGEIAKRKYNNGNTTLFSDFKYYIKSTILSEIPIDEGWQHDPELYMALEIFREAVIVCPDNSNPSWRILEILYREGRNSEAILVYDGMVNHKIDEYDMINTTPNIIGMLISEGRSEEAKVIAENVINKVSVKDELISIEAFNSNLLWGISNIKIDKIRDYINLLLTLDSSHGPKIAEQIIYKIKPLTNDENFIEALDWVNIAIEIQPQNKNYLDLRKEIKELSVKLNEWSQIKTKEELMRYLFRRLAFKYHPDLAENEEKRTENNKIMSEINIARGSNNLNELKEIAKKYTPEWTKYYKF